MARKYDITFLTELSEKLENIPEYSSNNYNNEKTLAESIDILKPIILSLSKKGYKSSLISELLINEGIESNPQYLKKLINQLLSSKKSKSKKIDKNNEVAIDTKSKNKKLKINSKEKNTNDDEGHKSNNSFKVKDDTNEL